jgi:RHS repeat-associated protein
VTYVYGLGLISATDAAGNQRYYFPDALGSTITTVKGSNRQVVGQYEYDVFGSLRVGSAAGEPFLFTGQQFDNKARDVAGGLYYLRNRVYDPSIGRFLTRDPLPGQLTAPQTQNRYPYVENNPVNRVDPRGLHDSEAARPVFLAVDPITQFNSYATCITALEFLVLGTREAFVSPIAGGLIVLIGVILYQQSCSQLLKT